MNQKKQIDMKKNIPTTYIKEKYARWLIGLSSIFVLLLVIEIDAKTAYGAEYAQQQTVTGTVIDADDGEPLPAVNVSVQGTTIGTSTNMDGEFELEVPSIEEDDLIFSMVGYSRLSVSIDGRTDLGEIELIREVLEGDEVVVVGYGQQRRQDMTESVSRVNINEAPPLVSQRADQMLQGRTSGTMVRNVSGEPGADLTIRIRGFDSITGSSEPLIVVDGLQGSDLQSLNPEDVQSIEVLKDAAATSIYGSEGASGVILVTTKQGQDGAPTINYSYDVSSSRLLKKMDLMGAADYAQYMNELEMANNLDREPQPHFTDQEIQEFARNGGTDWQDEIFRTAVTHNHQLSYGGGTDNINYRVSGAYLDQEGILLNSGYDRYTLRTNVRAVITDWFRVGANWSGVREVHEGSVTSGHENFTASPVLNATYFEPTIPVYDEDGNYSETSDDYGPSTSWNPVASAVEPDINNLSNRNEISTFLDFSLAEGLELQSNLGAILTNYNNRDFRNKNTRDGNNADGDGSMSSGESGRYQVSNILTYMVDYGIHRIEATGVTELKYNQSTYKSVNGASYLHHATGAYDIGGANFITAGSGHSERTILSGVGRINYNYSDIYSLSASLRRDGSSVFGEENKWATFPSVSAGFTPTSLDLFDNLGLLHRLRLRASWGKTGNQAISPYQTLAKLSTGSWMNYPYGGGGSYTGFKITSPANPDLRWETSIQRNIAVDLEFMDSRFRVSADYYQKDTEDLLMNREIPGSVGITSIIDNIGSLETEGFELSINVFGGTTDFTWSGGINMSTSETMVTDLGENEEIPFNISAGGTGLTDPLMYLVEGEPWGQIRGWEYLGTWNEDEAEEAARYGQLPGDPRYLDINDDGVIDFDNDRKTIGNTIPDVMFGINNRFSYRNFDLQTLIQGTYGNDTFNAMAIHQRTTGNKGVELIEDRWTPENQDTDVPAIIDEQTRHDKEMLQQNVHASMGGSSRWVEDGSYIRLKNVTIAYTLPVSIQNMLQVSDAQVQIAGTNLLTFTNYTGFDPEATNYQGDAVIGTDFGSYPSARSFTLGINFTF